MQPLGQQIRDAQAGDAKAVEHLMIHYAGLVRRECERFGTIEQADMSGSDSSQEVLLQVWMKLYQFRGGDSEEHTVRAFENWLKSTARSVLTNLYRNRNALKRQPPDGIRAYDEAELMGGNPVETSPTASSIFVQQEDAERVQQAMEHCLDDKSREIVQRYIVNGESFKEIAEILSLKYEDVRRTFNLACQRLERWLR